MPKQVWESDDGNQFYSEEECILYEKFLGELRDRDFEEEYEYDEYGITNGLTNESLARNFYDYLNSVLKSLAFLESVEKAAAPEKQMLRKQQKKEQEIEDEINRRCQLFKDEFNSKYQIMQKNIEKKYRDLNLEYEKQQMEFQQKIRDRNLEFERKEKKFKIDYELNKRLAIWEEIKEIDNYSSNKIKAGYFIEYWENVYKLKNYLGDINYAKIAKLFFQFYSGDISIKKLNEEITKAPIDELLTIFRDIKFTHTESAILNSDLIRKKVNKEKVERIDETIKDWQKTDNPEWVSGIVDKETNQNNSLIMKSIKWLFNSDSEK